MTTTEINQIKNDISDVLHRHANVSLSRSVGLLNISDLAGKLYEASVLAEIIERLATSENLRITLVGNGRHLKLKQSGSQINRAYPYFQIWRGNAVFAELFMDIFFTTLSKSERIITPGQQRGDYHELDLAVIVPGVRIKPLPEEILIAIECKNTTLKKSTIRELLGFRRELSYLDYAVPTNFTNWPADNINANPSSIHMLYTTHGSILPHYSANCDVFGIKLIHHTM